MKKLGKPDIGYRSARNLTQSEAKITGLKTSIIIMHEAGSGQITTWRKCRTGGLDRVILTINVDKILHKFWNS